MKQAGAVEMIELGIVQHPDAMLATATTEYDLPREAEVAGRDYARLRATADAVFAKHQTQKGLGVAGPQIGLNRRIAIFRPWGGEEVCLLNAKIVERSQTNDLKYEGCLSLFDKRGLVPRSLEITVTGESFDGQPWQRAFRNADARLIAHEIDHLDGVLYIDRMGRPTISIDEYRRLDDTDWTY